MPNSAPLSTILRDARPQDIAALANIITDNGKGRVALDPRVRDTLNRFAADPLRAKPALRKKVDALVASEITAFGGNTVANFMRGEGVDYHEVVCDVADHVGADYNKKQSTADIEMAVLGAILEKSLEQMSDEEKRKLVGELGKGSKAVAALRTVMATRGFASSRLAAIVANAVVKRVTGKKLDVDAGDGLAKKMARGAGVFVGPVGWAITGIWTAAEVTKPAFRVTVPAVVMVAWMRQRAGGDQRTSAAAETCGACGEPVCGAGRYCSACGTKIS